VRYLVRSVIGGANAPDGATRMQSIIVSTVERVPDEATLLVPLRADGTVAHIVIGYGALEGRAWGVARAIPAKSKDSYQRFAIVDSIILPGAGMHELKVSSPAQLNAVQRSQQPVLPPNLERWSRTIGALGTRVWQRLTSLRIAIIGCGRTGSLIAATLVRMGIRNLTLIDPDTVEEHNLGEMDGVNDSDIGHTKVKALADFLQRHCASSHAETSIRAVADPIVIAYGAALAADVIFSCVDSDAARLASGIIATLFHKVLVDIGTGIHFTTTHSQIRHPPSAIRHRIMGADIRLILPADGCLVCFGNLANYEEALAELSQRNRKERTDRKYWWERRMGSLRTLNMLAASVAVQMLCDLAAARIRSSTWVHVQYDQSSLVRMERIVRRASEAQVNCPLCIRAGLGLDGITWNSE